MGIHNNARQRLNVTGIAGSLNNAAAFIQHFQNFSYQVLGLARSWLLHSKALLCAYKWLVRAASLPSSHIKDLQLFVWLKHFSLFLATCAQEQYAIVAPGDQATLAYWFRPDENFPPREFQARPAASACMGSPLPARRMLGGVNCVCLKFPGLMNARLRLPGFREVFLPLGLPGGAWRPPLHGCSFMSRVGSAHMGALQARLSCVGLAWSGSMLVHAGPFSGVAAGLPSARGLLLCPWVHHRALASGVRSMAGWLWLPRGCQAPERA